MHATSDASELDCAPEHLTERVEAIYRAHHSFVWRCVRRMGIPRERAEDAVQDVFVVVSRRLSQFEGRSSIKTWLFSIVFRVVREHQRRVNRDAQEPKVWLASVPCDIQADLERKEAAHLLEQMLDTLEPRQRAVFVLAELEQLPAPEIAAAVGVGVNTVYSRLRLARRKLTRALERLRARERRSNR